MIVSSSRKVIYKGVCLFRGVHDNGFEVVPPDIDLRDFLREYWKMRLGASPCEIEKVLDKHTISEKIPNYIFSHSDAVISRRSFDGVLEDPCHGTVLLEESKFPEVKKGSNVYIVIGSTLFARSRNDNKNQNNYSLYDSGGNKENPINLVENELNAVNEDQLSVQINGKQLIGTADKAEMKNLRVDPTEDGFELDVSGPVGSRMEYPMQSGRYDAWTGGHCVVVKMNTPGSYHAAVDFGGVRSYVNRARAKIEVVE